MDIFTPQGGTRCTLRAKPSSFLAYPHRALSNYLPFSFQIDPAYSANLNVTHVIPTILVTGHLDVPQNKLDFFYLISFILSYKPGLVSVVICLETGSYCAALTRLKLTV